MTSPPFNLRIFAAVCFMTVVPSVTCPSDAIATLPPWRTQTTVVECHCSFFMWDEDSGTAGERLQN